MKMLKLTPVKAALKASSIGKIELLFSSVFTAILVAGHLLTTYDSIDAVYIGNAAVLAYSCGAIVIWGVILFGLVILKEKCLRKFKRPRETLLRNFSDKGLWLLVSSLIFACYLPLIALSMSVLTPDSWSSLKQLTGEAPLNNAHPIIFTAFVGIFVKIGLLFGSLELGITLFSLAQSAILAMIFAWVIVWMRREKIGKYAIAATFLFFAILPVNALAGIIMWKDILFAGFGLLFLLMLRQLYVEKGEFFTARRISWFIVLAFLFCALRTNGFYAYIIFLALISTLYHRTLFSKKYILLLLSPVALFVLYSNILALFVSPTRGVMVVVPLQQIARTVKYHSSSISEGDKKIINEILPFEQLGEKYNPNLSDPVAWTFNDTAFMKDRGKYVSLWFRLFLKHKKTYLAAFLYNTYGYAYPHHPSYTTTDVVLDNASHANAKDGYSDSAYERGGKIVAAKYRDLLASAIPLIHNIGFYVCIVLLGGYVAIIRRRKELAGVFILLSCLFLSIILGPVNGEFRYLYLFVVAVPFILASAFLVNKEEDRKSLG